MKKMITLLLCLLLAYSLIACGTIASQTVSSPSSSGRTSSSSSEQKSESVPLSPSGSEATSLPLNADTNSGYSLFGNYIGYIEFGSYPQTIAHHKAVQEMSETSDANGYYFSTWDNCYYAKITKSKVYGARFNFTTDTLIKDGETYYFKVEPIKWWVFIDASTAVSEGNSVTLISDCILESHDFCDSYERNPITQTYFRTDDITVYANNWAYSELRSWLNTELVKKIFTAEEEKKLLVRQTSSVTSSYKESDPTEKIWVPSSAEMLAYQTIFAAMPSARQSHYAQMTAIVTDYARCKNTFISIYPDYYGCGRYWTTTPGNNSYRVAFVPCDYHDNGTAGESAGATYMGVRPVIRLRSEDVSDILQDVE